ncbi:MAG: ATP-dependent RNA helicase RhlB [Chromatiales bacterium]|nr:ATP-dependent RNA helicase RhlB [Chromatiales bacterium]
MTQPHNPDAHDTSQQHLSDVPFAHFDLPPSVRQGLEDAGFSLCTPIQALTLPTLLAGRDVAGQAQTGTGKTAAFLVAVFTHLLRHPAPPERKPNQMRALILAPTRELAIQIHKDATVLGAHTGLTLALAYGGTDYEKQRSQIEAGADVLIGTPGRIIDYFKQHVFDLRMAQAMVLDEADRMFDLGFIADVRFLLRRMPPPSERLNMLFSATLSLRVMELAFEHMNSPEKLQVEAEQVTADRVRQSVYYPANNEKIPLLLGLLKHLQPPRSMVFVNMKYVAEDVTDWLNHNGVPAALLSGDVPQNKRQRLLGEFTNGDFQVLVATDVAARGLHIPDVTHIFNYDLPQSGEDYVHRIGRTGRAGAEGAAISFACEDFAFHLPEIEAYIGRKIPAEPVTPELLIEVQRPPRRERIRPPRDNRGGPGRGGRHAGPSSGFRDRPKGDAGSQKPPRRRRHGPPKATPPG